MDEHRIGLKPLLRRVWAPVGQRPLALPSSPMSIPPRAARSGSSLPASGIPLFEAELAAFARTVGAGHKKEIVLVQGPRRLAYESALAGTRPCASVVPAGAFPGIAAGRAPVAAEQ
jgi:hypothetical protein